ncbi:SAV_2336 N-terminal domain-related protein [Streptomyces sp. NPDC057798]|uniref:SAV_2336 N-terminal domain-related protein n=1 Tax=Streptomyces sp. NPDC057798 TaxID=3346252 RepID=UPI0036BB5786
MTDDLITRLLGDIQDRPTWQELADVLWLAGHLPPVSDGRLGAWNVERSSLLESLSRPESGPPTGLHRPLGADPPRPEPTQPYPDVPWDAPSATASLGLPGGHEAVGNATPVRLPTTPALRTALGLRRALRPLGRRTVPGPRDELQLDEEATVERIADTEFWFPVLRPAPIRWLDVALVVDDSVSMAVWGRAVGEFRDLLDTAGAFRSVQVWSLPSEESRSLGVVLRRGLPSSESDASAVYSSPGELVDPTGRRVVLVVSDCISPQWSDGTLEQALRMWGRSGPVAIVQPLPRRMWERCSLDLHSVTLRSPGPGAANTRLVTAGAPMPMLMPVPVLLLDPDSLGPWASLISGESPVIDALVTLVGSAPPQRPELPDGPAPPELSPAELVQRFRNDASPEAYKLIVYLSAVALSPPVMRIVQHQMLENPRPSQLAEIYLSGLLERTEDSAGARGDDIVFDFRPGVREELLGALRSKAARQILQYVTEYLETVDGSRIEFAALLRDDDTAVAELRRHRPFAEVSGQVLRRLHPKYETVAQKLERPYAPERTPEATAGPHKVWGTVPPRPAELLDREQLLDELHQALTRDGTVPQVLCAPEGGGATAVAVEYAHTLGSAFDYVLWLSAGSPTVGGTDLARFADELARRNRQGAEPSWLLVLDGAAPGEELPGLPGGRRATLITSVDPDWPEGFKVRRVPALRRRKAFPLARLHATEVKAPQGQRLAERFGGSPLGLELAATFLAVTGEMPEAGPDRLGPGDGSSAAVDPAVEACRISLDHVLREEPSAREVLHRLATLAAGPVPVKLLVGRLRQGAGQDFDPALTALHRLALLRGVEPGSELTFVHPVVRRACQERFSEEELAEARRAVRARMVEYYGRDAPDVPALWSRFGALTRHLDAVGALGDPDAYVRELVLRQLRYLRACGDTAGCRALGTLAVRRLADKAGAGHPGVQALVALLADVLEECGTEEGAAGLRADPEGWARREPGAT